MATTKNDDAGAQELQDAFDEAHAKGYFGSVPDPFPNSAYSLASGPASPTVTEVGAASAAATAPEPTKAASAAKKEKSDG